MSEKNMTEIQRWDYSYIDRECLEKNDGGDFVRYDDHERIVEAMKAENERLRKALESATDTMQIVTIGDDSKVNGVYVSNGYRYKGQEVIIETGYGETFVVSRAEDDQHLAAYLKEKEKVQDAEKVARFLTQEKTQ